jgi:outer membrane protein OmpA-like peptidoglycan-associated protein
VKIDFPVEKKIEQDLAQTGHAEIYGIYFDFDSANLRPESDPVLKEISEALTNNPDWKIKIDGHTDNKGADDYNLRLSQRRAESVKQALITTYGITEDRLTPEGFGASRPKAPNDTPEGRALNRRVELIKE